MSLITSQIRPTLSLLTQSVGLKCFPTLLLDLFRQFLEKLFCNLDLHNGWEKLHVSCKRSGSLSQAQLLHIWKGYKAARCVINAGRNTGFAAAWGKFFPEGIFTGFPKLCSDFPANIIVKQLFGVWVVFCQLGIYLVMLNCKQQSTLAPDTAALCVYHQTQTTYTFLLFLFKSNFLYFSSSRLSYNPLKNGRQGALNCLDGSWLEASLQEQRFPLGPGSEWGPHQSWGGQTLWCL